MILSGHQPNYWPYPGLIGKIMKSDRFVFVTKVQFEKKSWQKRNRVRTKEGWTYIQVPTITKGKMEQNICDVLINNNEEWREKNYKTISLLYGKAPFYNEYKDFLDINYIGEQYKQQFQGFEEGLTILDMLMNCGTEKTKEILLKDSNYEFSKLNKDM